jgi:hypothetical protein
MSFSFLQSSVISFVQGRLLFFPNSRIYKLWPEGQIPFIISFGNSFWLEHSHTTEFISLYDPTSIPEAQGYHWNTALGSCWRLEMTVVGWDSVFCSSPRLRKCLCDYASRLGHFHHSYPSSNDSLSTLYLPLVLGDFPAFLTWWEMSIWCLVLLWKHISKTSLRVESDFVGWLVCNASLPVFYG